MRNVSLLKIYVERSLPLRLKIYEGRVFLCKFMEEESFFINIGLLFLNFFSKIQEKNCREVFSDNQVNFSIDQSFQKFDFSKEDF